LLMVMLDCAKLFEVRWTVLLPLLLLGLLLGLPLLELLLPELPPQATTRTVIMNIDTKAVINFFIASFSFE